MLEYLTCLLFTLQNIMLYSINNDSENKKETL